jgi:hypothetical protein
MPLSNHGYNKKFDETIPPNWARDGMDFTGKRFDDPIVPTNYLKTLYSQMKKPAYRTSISLALSGRGETCQL